MWYRSAVSEMAWVGVQVVPSVKLVDFSSFNFGMPAALATTPPLGASTTSFGTPPMKSVKVVDKWLCCSDGARKPVLAEPRSSTLSATRMLPASLPVTVEPKSLNFS